MILLLFRPLKFRALVRWLTWLLLAAFLSIKSGDAWLAVLLIVGITTVFYQIIKLR